VKTTTGENSGLLELEAFMFNTATLMAYSHGHDLAVRYVVKGGVKVRNLWWIWAFIVSWQVGN